MQIVTTKMWLLSRSIIIKRESLSIDLK